VNHHDRWLGVLALAALTLALLAAGPRAARADATAAATENEVPVAGSALPEEAAEPGVADVASDATSLSKWWTDQPWRFNIGVYVWFLDAPVKIESGIHTTELPERFGKILAGLDMMAMLEFEVHKGPIGVFGLPIFYEGTVREHFRGPFQDQKVALEEKLWLIDYGVSYALGPWHLGKSDHSPAVTVEPFVGGRFLNDDITLDIDPGFTVHERPGRPDRVLFDPKVIELVEAIDPGSTRIDTSLVDTTIEFNTPIVGLRTSLDLTKRWTLTLRGDIGGFHVEGVQSTYQLSGKIAYNFKIWKISSNVHAGYRYLWVHYDEDDIAIKVRLRGPVVGIGFEF
jgi:hypothetical protein